MPLSEEQIREALKQVKYPGFSRDIVSFGLVKEIRIDNGAVTVQMALATNEPAIPQAIKTESEAALHAMAGVESAKVLIDIHAPPAGAGAAGSRAPRPGRLADPPRIRSRLAAGDTRAQSLADRLRMVAQPGLAGVLAAAAR